MQVPYSIPGVHVFAIDIERLVFGGDVEVSWRKYDLKHVGSYIHFIYHYFNLLRYE